jgi:hypothetical protein
MLFCFIQQFVLCGRPVPCPHPGMRMRMVQKTNFIFKFFVPESDLSIILIMSPNTTFTLGSTVYLFLIATAQQHFFLFNHTLLFDQEPF